MGSLSISSKMIDKYFGFLKGLNDKAKKSLITKLTNSLDTSPSTKFNARTLFGAWEDDRDSDEIIKEIRLSRVEKNSTDNL